MGAWGAFVRPAPRLAAVVLAVVCAFGEATAQEPVVERAAVPADDSVRRVVVRAPGSSLNVVGHDEARVLVEARSKTAPVPGGLGLTAVRTDERVVVEIPTAPVGTSVTVRVPRRVALELRGSNGGPFVVVDVRGEIEVENSNAGIKLMDVIGPVVAATSNGPIEVRFSRVPPARPMSFLTSNAPIRIVLPDGVDADLLLQTDTGVIRSDWPLERLEGAPLDRIGPPPEIPGAPRPGRIVRTRLGEGGPPWRLWTDNADIVFRRVP